MTSWLSISSGSESCAWLFTTLSPRSSLAFMDTTNVRMLLASIGTGIPVIVEEHIDPTQNPVGSDR